jgi:L,D-transpeptidase-like protein/putative peptidoglycan binding protein/PKD domain-containing protein
VHARSLRIQRDQPDLGRYRLSQRYCRLVRGAIVLFSGLAFTASAHAAPPAVTATATPAAGVAPFRVTLAAAGDAASYSWTLGDGATAVGPVVTHIYGVGRFVATLTATNAAGEVSQTQVALTGSTRTLTLRAPQGAGYGEAAVLAGSLRPAVRGAPVQIYRGKTYVTSARAGASGRFHAKLLLRLPGPYHARFGAARSTERIVRIRPSIVASLLRTAVVGSTLTMRPRLVPARAGSISVRVFREGRRVLVRRGAVRLPTGTPGTLRVELVSQPRAGYAPVRKVVTTQVVLPSLAPGSRGGSVVALERKLAELHYALQAVDGYYGTDTFEAVLAFQKVNGLPRTGRVEPWLWRRLANAHVPRAYRGGDHIEVDKTRQVLMVVRAGTVARVVHISTGATGNTPLGSWHVYRKVGGWDWVLWYPMYFKGGFAIHGYPAVPAFPASHGCVRVPMWIAPALFDTNGYGATVIVHL